MDNKIVYFKNEDENDDIETLFEVNNFKEFKNHFLVAENFYKDPNLVRNYAIDSFDYATKFPYGHRSYSTYLNDGIKHKIKKYVTIFNQEIDDNFFHNVDSNGSFLYTRELKNKTWIHQDNAYGSNWAGVIYMNNLKESIYGTTFYIKNRNGDNNYFLNDENYSECINMSRWFVCDKISNQYNKIVLYKAVIYHSIAKNFGKDKFDCRISQTFFF
jgi:hypothetical protein